MDPKKQLNEMESAIARLEREKQRLEQTVEYLTSKVQSPADEEYANNIIKTIKSSRAGALRGGRPGSASSLHTEGSHEAGFRPKGEDDVEVEISTEADRETLTRAKELMKRAVDAPHEYSHTKDDASKLQDIQVLALFSHSF